MTSFDEIYCLNAVIKQDQRLVGKPAYALYDLCWKYLQFAIGYFNYDCRKDLFDLVPFSLTEYSFIGDGENNIFNLNPAPTSENLNFYISTKIDCGQSSVEVNKYIYDSTNHTITFLGLTPAIGEEVNIISYDIGHFNANLSYDEKGILARGMNLPYYEEQITNSKILNFAVYGGSIKMHSQAEHVRVLNAALETAKREFEGDISHYSYRTAEKGLFGLGGRTVCLNRLRHKPKPTVSE